jgi:hypothetical protein
LRTLCGPVVAGRAGPFDSGNNKNSDNKIPSAFDGPVPSRAYNMIVKLEWATFGNLNRCTASRYPVPRAPWDKMNLNNRTVPKDKKIGDSEFEMLMLDG